MTHMTKEFHGRAVGRERFANLLGASNKLNFYSFTAADKTTEELNKYVFIHNIKFR